MKEWGFNYVENFVWMKKAVNDRLVTQNYDIFKYVRVGVHYRQLLFELTQYLPHITQEIQIHLIHLSEGEGSRAR